MLEFVCKFDHIDGKSWSDDYNKYKDSFIKKRNKLELYSTMIGETIKEEQSRINEYKVNIRMNNLNTNSHYIGRKVAKKKPKKYLIKQYLILRLKLNHLKRKLYQIGQVIILILTLRI